jgi:hypothetical protein
LNRFKALGCRVSWRWTWWSIWTLTLGVRTTWATQATPAAPL